MTMLRLALANDAAIQRVQRGKQCRHTMAFVIVRHRLSATSFHRQARLGPVKRLDLRLLIATEDQCVFRRIEIQPDDVFQLLLEVFVVRYLEGFYPMRLESMRLPDAPHARRADTAHRRHTARAPMRRVIRTLLRRQRHDRLDLACRDLRLAPRSRLIPLDPRHTIRDKARSPARHRASPNTELRSDLFVCVALRREQYHLGALGQSNRDPPASRPRFQLFALAFAQLNFCRDSHGFSLLAQTGDSQIAIKLHYL
ncbi:hypothetical protein CNECB9_1950002 [Cupriavidus necator]|uniref:Uncharacterized protein n=1 Tax=Cupriavidus necator TaxID=106590 RepID=A0A1K0IP92_CUPNE|nr:hypothetical protein CNECB9_1950002 [Cupriavidus necator]